MVERCGKYVEATDKEKIRRTNFPQIFHTHARHRTMYGREESPLTHTHAREAHSMAAAAGIKPKMLRQVSECMCVRVSNGNSVQCNFENGVLWRTKRQRIFGARWTRKMRKKYWQREEAAK